MWYAVFCHPVLRPLRRRLQRLSVFSRCWATTSFVEPWYFSPPYLGGALHYSRPPFGSYCVVFEAAWLDGDGLESMAWRLLLLLTSFLTPADGSHFVLPTERGSDSASHSGGIDGSCTFGSAVHSCPLVVFGIN